MPILMTRSTFAALADVREQLVSKTFAASTDDQASPGDIFVPWAGVKLLEGPGIYMVGIAVDAEASEGRHSFESCLQATEAFCANRRHEREHSPFWRFLDGVGEESLWNKEHQEEAGLWWLSEAATGNLYVHGYHPSHARRQRFFEAALKRTVELARTHLSPFI
jgi:hypothetical protein